jgi:hypothetical protein
MTGISRRGVLLVAVVALAGSALILPAVSAGGSAHIAKTYAFKMKTTAYCSPFPGCSSHGVDGTAVYKGTPFGTCKATTKLVLPRVLGGWKCKGGTFKLVSTSTSGASNDTKGTWKITRGSGTRKYKGISGKGTFTGKISTGIYTLKGKVSY